jgi:hypothetical protein
MGKQSVKKIIQDNLAKVLTEEELLSRIKDKQKNSKNK